MPDAPALITLKDVRFTWADPSGFGLHVPDFSLQANEKVLLLGESGSGKSTLLSLICGTIVPDTGSINVCGKNTLSLSARQRDRHRADNIGLIFQQFNLLPFANVQDNILLALKFATARRTKIGDTLAEVAQLCTDLGLPPEILKQKAKTLSVGQQQRVAAARALIGAPPLIIADEPTSSLDATMQRKFLDLLFDQAAANRSSLLMVSHDPRLGDHFDRVLDISDITIPWSKAA